MHRDFILLVHYHLKNIKQWNIFQFTVCMFELYLRTQFFKISMFIDAIRAHWHMLLM